MVTLLSKLRQVQHEANECLERENARLKAWEKYPMSLEGRRMEIEDEYGFPTLWKVVKEIKGGEELVMVEISGPVTNHKGKQTKRKHKEIKRSEFVEYRCV